MNSNLLPPRWNFSPPFHRSALALAAATVLLTLNFFVTSSASAAPPIEGVWSFNGGRIAIQEQSPGVFEGTVVSPTTFSLCAHPEGEEMWTQMVEQPDGSFWGDHQWFFETSECVRNPALGQTAWRVLQNAKGRYLRACFSEPGSNLQPTIAKDGAESNATFGCVDSALLAEVPEASVPEYLRLPSNKACTAAHRLRLHVRSPRDNPVSQVSVTASGGGVTVKAKVHKSDSGIFAVVPLTRFSSPKIAVKVRVTTLLGQQLKTRRTYRRCALGKHKTIR
jgi:hypothetical protein